MQRACEEKIEKALELTNDLLALADSGEAESQDAGCAVLFGIVRDCAYRIRRDAERERAAHAGGEAARKGRTSMSMKASGAI